MILIRLSILTIAFLLIVNPAISQEVVCMKKALKVKNGKVLFKKAFATRSGACLKKEVQITDQESAASILEKLKTVDGAGSTLDADLLDGIDSTGFAKTGELTATNERVTKTESDIVEQGGLISDNTTAISGHTTSINNNTSAISGHTTSITNNASAISTLNTDLGTAEQAIENLQPGINIVRVGKTNAQYTSLEDAVTFVNSQVRSSSSPWLIEISPGTFNLTTKITVPTFTNIEGAGKFSTIISGSGS